MPLAFVCAFALFLVLPRIDDNDTLRLSFAGAAIALLGWLAFLWYRQRTGGMPFRFEVSLRSQHYLQAIAHTSIFVYWGFYWAPIEDAAALIAAQIVFAYAFDMLLSWSMGRTYAVGFGPFPVIYSINLFLRFQDDWFYFQFLMVATGFLAKAFIRWERDGRKTHIFNPSSFPLALFSIVLIAAGASDITWGEGIATQLILPPHIYLFIFLVALPGQYLFRVTSMTLPAVLTTYGFSQLYLLVTGTYFFFDSSVPIAVFLGMHLLFTDPSTSPRTELGRVLFGVIYGLTVVVLYVALGWIGAPLFYDKLIQVPFMNLSVRWIDRLAESPFMARLSPARIGAALAPRRRSLVYVSLWALVFTAMSVTDGVGDHHPGHTVEFWQQACDENRSGACEKLATVELRACENGSSWACNELGILTASGRVAAPEATASFQRGCGLGLRQACANSLLSASGPTGLQRSDPSAADFSVLLRGAKSSLPEKTPLDIFARACDFGWMSGCNDLARFYFTGDGVPADKTRAIALLDRACTGQHGLACANAGQIYRNGDGVGRDDAMAREYLGKACALSVTSACESP